MIPPNSKIADQLRIICADSPAIRSVASRACAWPDGEARFTASHQAIASEAEPFCAAIVDNLSFAQLLDQDVIRPLDDLIARLDAEIPEHGRVKADGQIMAIAFMADTQVLAGRRAVLEQAGLEMPTSVEALLAAARAIRDAGIMKYPLGGAYGAGLPRVQAFCDFYIGCGGKFFESGTTDVALNAEHGIAALKEMQALAEFMAPNALTHDEAAARSAWNTGQAALMRIWDSGRADLAGDTLVGGPLTLGGSDMPAASLWWRAWVLSKHLSDKDALAAFKVMAGAVSPSLLDAKTMPQALWLVDGFEASTAHHGVLETVAAGTSPFPIESRQARLMAALGVGLEGVLEGRKDAAQALADVEAVYAAKGSKNASTIID